MSACTESPCPPRTVGELLDLVDELQARGVLKLVSYGGSWQQRNGGSMALLIRFGPDQAKTIGRRYCSRSMRAVALRAPRVAPAPGRVELGLMPERITSESTVGGPSELSQRPLDDD